MSGYQSKNYRKHIRQLPEFTITYKDSSQNQHTFHITKAMLKSHEILMSNNPYVTEFKVNPYKGD